MDAGVFVNPCPVLCVAKRPLYGRIRGMPADQADALGIAACLYAYSHLSFDGDDAFVETCTVQYHLLRDYMLEHAEARRILAIAGIRPGSFPAPRTE